METVEVLMSTLELKNEKEYIEKIEKAQIKTNVTIVNQKKEVKKKEIKKTIQKPKSKRYIKKDKIERKIYTYQEKGASKSRNKLIELAKTDKRIVAVTASMKDGTGLAKFAKEFPTRFFDIGIAEQHALTMAAGMAIDGMIPFVPIYSSFYQRAYDQVIHDIAMQNLPVIMCVDRAGAVGADGETHQGTLDMAFFRLVPNLTIMAPKDFKELEDMMEFAVKLNKPVVIRYPRGGQDENIQFEKHQKIELGKAEILRKGQNVSIIAIGKRVAEAMKIADKFKENGIEAEVINARFLKPLDEETIKKSIEKTKNVITIEDGTKINGLGTAVEELIVENNLQDIKFEKQAWPDEFLKQGTEWKCHFGNGSVCNIGSKRDIKI